MTPETMTKRENPARHTNPLDLVLCDNTDCNNAIINGGISSDDGLGVFCSEECKQAHERAEFMEWIFAADDQPIP